MTDIAACVERARQSWNAGDLPGYLALYDDRIQLHGYSPAPMGKAEATGFYEMVAGALAEEGRATPSLAFHEVLVDGDLYCCRFTMEGVHGGEFMGVPATGRRYSLAGITIMRFDGERVVERWSTADFLGMLTQIGALPAPA